MPTFQALALHQKKQRDCGLTISNICWCTVTNNYPILVGQSDSHNAHQLHPYSLLAYEDTDLNLTWSTPVRLRSLSNPLSLHTKIDSFHVTSLRKMKLGISDKKDYWKQASLACHIWSLFTGCNILIIITVSDGQIINCIHIIGTQNFKACLKNMNKRMVIKYHI